VAYPVVTYTFAPALLVVQTQYIGVEVIDLLKIRVGMSKAFLSTKPFAITLINGAGAECVCLRHDRFFPELK